MNINRRHVIGCVAAAAGSLLTAQLVYSGFGARFADGHGVSDDGGSSKLPGHGELAAALGQVVAEGGNAGFALNMWATMVNRDGEVQAVAFSGEDRGDQWPGSRVISAQKANTANAFSLPGLALSTSNLFSAVQPGGSLYGLQHSNPVDTGVAYRGPAAQFGKADDPMVGSRVGGVNVFGGGLPLYNAEGELVGAIGVSGDTSCTDHIIAWKVRHALNLDHVPGGVSATGDDNAVYDISNNEHGDSVSASGWGHPDCGGDQKAISDALPETHPVGPEA
jgi:uncharacterized protein GlcG (DUF336 family)